MVLTINYITCRKQNTDIAFYMISLVLLLATFSTLVLKTSTIGGMCLSLNVLHSATVLTQ